MGIAACATLLLASGAAAQGKEVIRAPGAPPGLPFSPAVRVGDLLFLSGQIGTVPGTRELAPGGIGPETRQTLENIRTVLDYAGATLADVVKCTVFLQDIAEWPAMNESIASSSPKIRRPARRSPAAASRLAREWRSNALLQQGVRSEK